MEKLKRYEFYAMTGFLHDKVEMNLKKWCSSSDVDALEVRIKLHEASEQRWLPCPDHRDKVNGECQVCRAEKLEAENAKLRDEVAQLKKERMVCHCDACEMKRIEARERGEFAQKGEE